MVVIAFQDDVKRAFSKVKEDSLNLKRSMNRQLLAIDELNSRVQAVVAKEEFYNFIKRLGERLDKIEEGVEAYSGYEDELKEFEAKIRNLGKKLSRQENLSAEIKEVRTLGGKINELEGSAVNVQRFNSEVGRLMESISSVKKKMLTGKALEDVKSAVNDVNKRVEGLEKSVPSKESVSDNLEGIKSLRASFEKLEGESGKRLDLLSNNLRKDAEGVKEAFVDKDLFSKKIEDIKRQQNSFKLLLDSSVSEVDLSDYATKRELDGRLSQLARIKDESVKLSSDVANIEERLESLMKGAATLDDVNRISDGVKGLSKSVDALKSGMEKMAELVQNRFEKRLEQTSAKFEKGLIKLKSEFEGKLVKAKGRQEGPGFLSRIGRGFADFFKEEELPEKEEKEKASVSEVLKEGERKRWIGPGRALVGAVIGLLLVAGLFSYFSFKAGVGEEQLFEKVGKDLEEAAVGLPKDVNGVGEGLKEAEGSLIEGNKTPASSVVTGAEEGCREMYECKERVEGEYWFNCYVDKENVCRCFVTDAEGCGIVAEAPSVVVREAESGLRGNAFYLTAAAAILLLMIVFYILSSRDRKEKEDKKEDSEENSVDLEEFFQKK